MFADATPSQLSLLDVSPGRDAEPPPRAVSVCNLDEASGMRRSLILVLGQPLGVLVCRPAAHVVTADVWSGSFIGLRIAQPLRDHYCFPAAEVPDELGGLDRIVHFWLRYADRVLDALCELAGDNEAAAGISFPSRCAPFRTRTIEQVLTALLGAPNVARLLTLLHQGAGEWREALVSLALDNHAVLRSWPESPRDDDNLLPLFLLLRQPYCGWHAASAWGAGPSVLRRLRHLPIGLVWEVVHPCLRYSPDARHAYFELLEKIFRYWWRSGPTADPDALARLRSACTQAQRAAWLRTAFPAPDDRMEFKAAFALLRSRFEEQGSEEDEDERAAANGQTLKVDPASSVPVARFVIELDREAIRVATSPRRLDSHRSLGRWLNKLPERKVYMEIKERLEMLAYVRADMPELPDDEDPEAGIFSWDYWQRKRLTRQKWRLSWLLLSGHTVTLVPLLNFAALFREGRAMHNCVARYWIDLSSDRIRMFSVFIDGARWATLSFLIDEDSPNTRWSLDRCKGRFNRDRMATLDADHELRLIVGGIEDLFNHATQWDATAQRTATANVALSQYEGQSVTLTP